MNFTLCVCRFMCKLHPVYLYCFMYISLHVYIFSVHMSPYEYILSEYGRFVHISSYIYIIPMFDPSNHRQLIIDDRTYFKISIKT